MTSQSSDDPDDVTLGEEDQEELRDTLTGHGLAPTAQDPDEDEAYTPTQDEERSWQTFEHSGWRDLRRRLKFPNLIVSLTRLGHVLEEYIGPFG